LFIDRVVLI